MRRQPRSDARQRILDAAHAVAGRTGAAHMTLDAVAAEAGVSKGGLLYHFASKDLLLQGMVDQHMAEHRKRLDEARARFPDHAGGYLQACVDAQRAKSEFRKPKATQTFIAAAVNTPELLDAPRQYAREHAERMRALGPDHIEGLLITLALDGLFLGETFEMIDLTLSEREALLQAIADRAETVSKRCMP